MPPAARITDMHVCPIVIPFTPPHIGGPIITGKFNVIVGKMPAARVLDKLICKGPPDLVLKGSPTVIIGKLPAARMFDPTVHGGLIVTGFFPVIIGEFGMGSVIGPAAPVIAGLKIAAQKGLPVVPDTSPPAPHSYVAPAPTYIPPPMTTSGPAAIQQKILAKLASPDPDIQLEGQVASFLQGKGLLHDVDTRVPSAATGLPRQIDIVAGKAGEFVVEVTNGKGRGKIAQAAGQAAATKKPVIIYGPNVSKGFEREAVKQGHKVARTFDELERLVGGKR